MGTSFDFKSYKEDEFIKLTVSTGKVRVNVADQDLQLAVSPNEHLSINKIDGNVRKESIEENNYIKWIHGSLYFNKEPIREVIKTINRTYRIRSHIEESLSFHLYNTFLFIKIAGNY